MKFTLYWLDGKREVIEGRDAADAVSQTGYGAGALRALDFWASGDNGDYEWDATTRRWEAKPDTPLGQAIAEAHAREQIRADYAEMYP